MTQTYQSAPAPYWRWIIFAAALLPFLTMLGYLMFKPAPKRLRRNFPPAATTATPEASPSERPKPPPRTAPQPNAPPPAP